MLVCCLVAVMATSGVAFAQDADTPAAPSEFLLDNVEGADGEVGGADAEQVDAEPVQAEEIEEGEEPENVSRFERRQIEEIVVQARKRSELLEDTPISVTALGESTLREAGVVRLDQIQELVPNVQFQTGLSGQDVQLYIRGVGTDRADLAFDPGVGVYIDGVFYPRAQGALLDVLDVQQIEVLRGPQGTLFGKNTVGGAINMTTVKPGDSLEGQVLVRAGNYNSVVTRASLNVPVDIGWFEDKLFSRVTFGSVNRKGYVYNALRDEYWSDANSVTFLGALRFLPTEDITIDLSGTWSREHTYGSAGYCQTVNRDAGLGSPQLFNACDQSDDPYLSFSDTAQLQDIESYGTWMTATWDLPDFFGIFQDNSIRNLTSWRRQHPRRRADVDNTRIPSVDLEEVGGESYALNGAAGYAQQISTELQFTGNITDKFNYIAGYFVFWEQGEQQLSTLVNTPLNVPTNPPYPPGITDTYCEPPGVICLPRTTRRNTQIDNWTWAVFTQGTYDITDWFALTAGIRYTEDKKGLNFQEYAYTEAPYDIPPEPALPDPVATNNRAIFSSWTPMASFAATVPETFLDETVVDHLMGYFTYSRGFKGGGFSAITGGRIIGDSIDSFGPETLDNFEIGLKTISFDQLLTMNLALFMGVYKDIQVTTNEDVGTPDNPQIATYIENAAAATTRGVEFEMLARPIDGLLITGNVGYLDATYDNFTGTQSGFDGSLVDRSGENFKGVPKFRSYIAAQYSTPVNLPGPAWLNGWVTPRVEWSYTSAINFVGPEVPEARQQGWNAINARLSYSFMGDNAEVALWARNLLNQRVVTWMSPIVNSFGVLGKYYGIDRTFGAELSYRF